MSNLKVNLCLQKNAFICSLDKVSNTHLCLRFVLFNATFAAAQDELFIEGGHYERLDEAQPVQTGDKIEVVEMFWYRCPHCFSLEPFIVNWLETIPENVQYVPVPAIFSKRWEFEARVYYTFEALEWVEKLHGEYFSAIHEQRKKIDTVQKLASWVDQQGENGDAVSAVFNSFAVENKIRFSSIMGAKYGITGVPAIIVDGRYRTSVSLAGSHEKLIEVINFLIEKSSKARENPA